MPDIDVAPVAIFAPVAVDRVAPVASFVPVAWFAPVAYVAPCKQLLLLQVPINTSAIRSTSPSKQARICRPSYDSDCC